MIALLQQIPANVRAMIYGLYTVIVFVIGGIQIAYATGDSGQPDWIVTTLAVLAYVGAALGITASANASQVRAIEPVGAVGDTTALDGDQQYEPPPPAPPNLPAEPLVEEGPGSHMPENQSPHAEGP